MLLPTAGLSTALRPCQPERASLQEYLDRSQLDVKKVDAFVELHIEQVGAHCHPRRNMNLNHGGAVLHVVDSKCQNPQIRGLAGCSTRLPQKGCKPVQHQQQSGAAWSSSGAG